MRLKGKVALVIEGAGGVGREVAAAFAREGARVVLTDRDRRRAEAAAAALHGAGRRVIGLPMDVGNETQVDAAVAAAVEIFGRLDVLVSVAGIDFAVPIDLLDMAQWRRAVTAHLDGAFLATRAALPHMYEQGGGRIIYIGSALSEAASALAAPYVSARHGFVGLAEVVAREGGAHGVRAKVICPGFVPTAVVGRNGARPGTIARGGCEADDPADAAEEGVTAGEIAAAALAFAASEPPRDRAATALVAATGR